MQSGKMFKYRLIQFGFLLICFYPIVMKSKLSKAMKEKQEEANLVKNDIHNTISYQELRKMLLVVSDDEGSHKDKICSPQNEKYTFQSRRTSVNSERLFLVNVSKMKIWYYLLNYRMN